MDFDPKVVRALKPGDVFESGLLFEGAAPTERITWTVVETVIGKAVNEEGHSYRVVCRLHWMGVFLRQAVILDDDYGCRLKGKFSGA